jgi:hypothetical protein
MWIITPSGRPHTASAMPHFPRALDRHARLFCVSLSVAAGLCPSRLLAFAMEGGQGSAGVLDGAVFGAAVLDATSQPLFDGLQSGFDAGGDKGQVHLQDCGVVGRLPPVNRWAGH